MAEVLYWHCLDCGDHEPVAPTGEDAQDYKLGDMEPCIKCSSGTAHVMTFKRAACYEQWISMGLSPSDAKKRAYEVKEEPRAQRRAPVQGERIARDECPPGTVSWEEHEEAWRAYSERYGTDQTAERMAERGGFGLFELCVHLKRPPTTWKPR